MLTAFVRGFLEETPQAQEPDVQGPDLPPSRPAVPADSTPSMPEPEHSTPATPELQQEPERPAHRSERSRQPPDWYGDLRFY